MRFRVFNDKVYGMDEALIRAGYPMQVEVSDMPSDFTVDEYIKLIRRGKRLGNSPHGHGDDKFLQQIMVGFDVTAPRYWWQEFATYHFTVKNSQSTMHRMTQMDLKKSCNEYTDGRIIEIATEIVKEYLENPTQYNFQRMKSNVPEGLMLTVGIMTNYAQLKTIYYQRKNHKLLEWKDFCHWIETLPNTIAFGVCDKQDEKKDEQIEA